MTRAALIRVGHTEDRKGVPNGELIYVDRYTLTHNH